MSIPWVAHKTTMMVEGSHSLSLLGTKEWKWAAAVKDERVGVSDKGSIANEITN